MDQGSLRERKQARVREQIVEAAYALFEEHGFVAVSVTDIAERAEVGRTTFFRHFGDKQEVLFADEQRLLDRVAATAMAVDALRSDTVAEALAQLKPVIADLCAIVTEDESRYRRRERLVEGSPELQDRRRRKQDNLIIALEQVLAERCTSGPVAAVAAQVAGACYFAGRRLAGDEPGVLVESTRQAFRLLGVGTA